LRLYLRGVLDSSDLRGDRRLEVPIGVTLHAGFVATNPDGDLAEAGGTLQEIAVDPLPLTSWK
jgi:hypothetical protein